MLYFYVSNLTLYFNSYVLLLFYVLVLMFCYVFNVSILKRLFLLLLFFRPTAISDQVFLTGEWYKVSGFCFQANTSGWKSGSYSTSRTLEPRQTLRAPDPISVHGPAPKKLAKGLPSQSLTEVCAT